MARQFLIVEDHPIYAEALSDALSATMASVTCSCVGTLQDATRKLQSGVFDLVLLDLWLPDAKGCEGLLDLRRRFPRQPVAIVSAFFDRGVVHRAMACGAAGFIAKSERRAGIKRAVARILRGYVVVPQDHWAVPAQGRSDAELRERVKTLTRQQLSVLRHMCDGMLNKQIAHALNVGETTVKAHVSEILRKLKVSSRTQAVVKISQLDQSIIQDMLSMSDEDQQTS